jgi:branched-chain amino acid transport system ATP-binding protein
MLSIKDLSIEYGGLKALSHLDLDIQPSEVRGLIGPNGAGKTTLINCISGLAKWSAGDIFIQGQSIANLKPEEINRSGISRTFQHVQIFGDRSVLDHVLTGMHRQINCSTLSQIFGLPRARSQESQAVVKAMELLRLFKLDGDALKPVNSLPYGVIKRVDLARAVATRPRLLLLDEPTSGMGEEEALEVAKLVKNIAKSENITLLIIEHNMRLMMRVAEKISVLHLGQLVCEGSPQEVQNNPLAIEAYLGEEVSNA